MPVDRKLIASLSAAISLGTCVFAAQPILTASATRDRGPAVRALLLAPGSPNVELVTIAAGKVSSPFNIGASGLSQILFPGDREFVLAMKDTSSESGFRNLSTVRLPEGGNTFILLLEPSESQSLKTHVVQDRQQDFAPNATLFFNASASQIGAVFADQKSLIRPHRVEIVTAPPRKGDEPYYQVELYHPDNNKLKLFASSRWLHRDDGRNYVFIHQNKDSGTFSYQTFNETLSVQN